MHIRHVLSSFIMVIAGAPLLARAQSNPAGVEFFEKKVRPVLAEHCYKCHSARAEKLKAGLHLDSRDAMLKGGDSGAAIVPGDPAKSLLIKAIKGVDPDMQMPPKTKLPEAVVADLTTWVKMGAPWPSGASSTVAQGKQYPADYEKLKREHWAWQPVKVASAPAVRDAAWPRHDLDRFILAQVEAAKLKPAGDADKVALIRRVTFDLTGLPPTLKEVDAFVADSSPNAFATVVDRLLASPQFGERWGRHWLDVARYAESTGFTRNYPYSYAWRYRDYVIDAFNKDKPYDRFIQEQIAGDLMPAETAAQRNEQNIATGFLAMGVKDLNERNAQQFLMDNIDEQVDVTTRAVLALTASCGRCHDHKFDPVPTEEYYALAGIFRSTTILSGLGSRQGGGNRLNPSFLVKLEEPGDAAAPVPAVAKQAEVRKEADRVTELTAKVEALRAELKGARDGLKKLDKAKQKAGNAELAEKQALMKQLQKELTSLQAGSGKQPAAAAAAPPSGPMAMGVRDEAKIANCRICIRGDVDNQGAEVPRGLLSVVQVPSFPGLSATGSGRLDLAKWLTDARNPLTARVMANRIWQHLFGTGLVRTVDNFGVTGEKPTHPELLDHLAARLVQNQWSVKKTIREVVLSRTYQLAGSWDDANGSVDPGNKLLWRSSPRRLEAEAIRDAMLAASGTLNLQRPNGSPVMSMQVAEIRQNPGQNNNKGRFTSANFSADASHRSVYLPVLRSLVPPELDVFDFAEPTLVMGNREVTTVATQALYMMNNDFVVAMSQRTAERILAGAADDDARVDLAYRVTVSRPATSAERSRAVEYIAAFKQEAGQSTKDTKKLDLDAWSSFCQALFASAEFRYVN